MQTLSQSRGSLLLVRSMSIDVVGREFALDPIRLEGKQVCHCDIEVLDLEFRGKRYVARVTKFEMYKSSKSSGGSTSSRDGELLIYLKVNNNSVHYRYFILLRYFLKFLYRYALFLFINAVHRRPL